MSKGLAPVEFADKSTQTEAKCEFSEVHATNATIVRIIS